MSWERQALRAARRWGISRPDLFVRQMGQEAHGQDLTSGAGAQGPAQIMPATAAAWGLSPSQVHRRGPAYNAAAKAMAQYERQFGSFEKALVAYNAGPGRVGGPLPKETQDYIRIITGGQGASGPSPVAGGMSQPAMARNASVELRRQHLFDAAGYQQATQRAKVGEFLRSQGKGNSILFRSGLLGGDAPTREEFTTTRLRSKLIPGVAASSSDSLATGDAGLPSGQVGTAIRQARAKLGIAEIGTSNTGPKIDKWERSFGMVGAPWCGIFLGTVLRQAGVRGIDSRIASVSAIEQMARSRQGPFAGWASPGAAAAGDALVTAKGQHVVFVTGRSGNVIHTIGGNSGGRVQRVDYRADQVYGVARIRYAR